jgi:hypothetical protein
MNYLAKGVVICRFLKVNCIRLLDMNICGKVVSDTLLISLSCLKSSRKGWLIEETRDLLRVLDTDSMLSDQYDWHGMQYPFFQLIRYAP